MRVPRRLSMNRREDFALVRREGRSVAGRYLVMGTLASEALPHLKTGMITSRKVGKAVTRNRIRRRLRAILSKHGDKLDGARYLVLVARHRAGEASFRDLEREWLRLARRLEILPGPDPSE